MILEQIQGFISTPNLWNENLHDLEQFNVPNIDLQELSPNAIVANRRLGHQVEAIFQQIIEFSEHYELLVYNEPIRNLERTLGEIDFILRDRKNKQIIHVELTYKFYLLDNDIENPIHQLIGPNRKDTFYDKLEKIKTQQIELLQTKEAKAVLNTKNIDSSKIVSKTCFKAQIFTPYSKNVNQNEVFDPKCIYGFWIKMIDFNLPEFVKYHYYLPHKQEWILTPHNKVSWSTFEEIRVTIDAYHKKQQSPMIWIKKITNELEKAFVVWW